MNFNSKIFVAGHSGMVGSSCLRILRQNGYKNLIYESSSSLDLRDQAATYQYLKSQKPDLIINCAAFVGGILANNNKPYEFLMNNMLIQNNLIESSYKLEVKKFIFLGSSCIYPKFANQPIKEEYLLSGDLEPTNQWYAIAKISGVKLIESLRIQYNYNYVSLMPTNLYGTHDNFNLETSHVLPALIRKFHEAKVSNSNEVTLWGSGTPLREFLHVDDLSQAILLAIKNDFPDHLYNVGSSQEISINNLALMIKKIVGYNGKILWDSSKPDGTPRKLMDSSKINKLGFSPKISLEQGIIKTYKWYLENRIN